jgi:glutamate formiminotransferase / formiminotetrahydrofolate cyclodeaminase
VTREAKKHGVTVAGSEIVGLVPQLALIHAAGAALQLERFDATQVLETRLDLVLAQASGMSSGESQTLAGFLDAVAAGTPTPGGGSVAALAGALAAALGAMVCRLGPPPDAAQKKDEGKTPHGKAPDLRTVEQRLIEVGHTLRALIKADADAYQAVLRAYRLPKTDPTRPDAIASSLATATRVPLETAALAAESAFLLRSVIPVIKPSAASDLKVGLIMALAAIEGGLENVMTNLKSQPNQKLTGETRERVLALQQSLVELKRL